MIKKSSLAIILILLVLSVTNSFGATIKDLGLGEQWFGETLSKDNVFGHVVMVYFFSKGHPPSYECMPMLVGWVNKYSAKGFVLIGVQCPIDAKITDTKETVSTFCWSKLVNFPVFQGGEVRGLKLTNIPRVFIFNYDGEIAYDNDKVVEETAQTLKELMDKAPDPLLGLEPYVKLKALAQKVAERKDLGKVMAELRGKLESTDATEKTEANRLFGLIDIYAQLLRKKAESRKEDLLQYCFMLADLAVMFKGDEIAKEAEGVIAELKKDKSFKASLECDNEIRGLIASLKPCQPTQPLDLTGCNSCQKKNKATIEKILEWCRKMSSQYPGSLIDIKAKELLKKYTLEPVKKTTVDRDPGPPPSGSGSGSGF
ncbi:MAG: hypothetical protein V1701_11705 [Planctomycetota bacterium]